MPAKSLSQKKLFSWAYACKKGYVKDCPEKIKNVGGGMTDKQLKKFFEGMVYSAKKANQDLLRNFLVWLDDKEVEYIYDEPSKELEIFNEFSLSKDDNFALLQYIKKLGLDKVWEAGAPAVPGANLSNLGVTTGQGSVRMASTSGTSNDFTGSGDRFDNDNYDLEDDWDEEDDPVKKKRKKAKHKDKYEKLKQQKKDEIKKQYGLENYVISFNDFLNERLTAKRIYTENHPAKIINRNTPIRNKVLEFVGKRTVSESAMRKFFSAVSEDLGREPKFEWLSRNKAFVQKIVKEGKTFYRLTERGRRILELQKNN